MPDSVQQNTRVGKKPRAFPERRGSQRSITRTGIVCQWSCQALACDPQWGERCSCGGSVACGRQCQAEDREDARRLEHRGDDQWRRQEAATWQRERVMKRSVRNRCPGPDSLKKNNPKTSGVWMGEKTWNQQLFVSLWIWSHSIHQELQTLDKR